MYVPAAFRETRLPVLHDFMEQHSFATLISHGANGFIASHLPVLLSREEGDLGCLYGHVAKANPHQAAFGQEGLVVFRGPHAYISPTWYGEPNTVPTWNYVAVHVSGVVERLEDHTAIERILIDSVARFEHSQPQPWPFDPTTEFHQKLREAVVGFRMPISHIDGKWKLNQNHPVERRTKVAAELRQQGTVDATAIADLIQSDLPNG